MSIEYRIFNHGNKEKINVLGIGAGCLVEATEDEIEKIFKKAIEKGINFFDLCAGSNKVYAPFGKAIKGVRDKIYFQLHFGAVYNEQGDYGWSRDLNEVKKTFEWELSMLNTTYIDFGFLHCIDEIDDLQKIIDNGILDYVLDLKKKGIVHYIGFSSHTPAVAHKVLDLGVIDMMMFSINPAYDFEKGDEYGIGTTSERMDLFRRCETLGVGISVMKPFHGGKLLLSNGSPFGEELNHFQCIKYALDRPGVVCVVPGVRNLFDLEVLLKYYDVDENDKDYSIIGKFTTDNAKGTCVYCNHCKPCPQGLDIGLINKYYDLALMGDNIAASHYNKLTIKADNCIQCGHCNSRCPFEVNQMERMKKINDYFSHQ